MTSNRRMVRTQQADFPGNSGLVLLGWVGIHSPAFSRFWSRPRKHRFSAVPHQHSTPNSNQDKYTTDIHWGRYIFTNGREKILLLVEDVLLIGNSTSLWQAIFCLESGKYKKGVTCVDMIGPGLRLCRYDRVRSPSSLTEASRFRLALTIA